MKFLKAHGLENEFIILENQEISPQTDLGELAQKMCNRRTGVGADGILIVAPSEKANFKMRIINADGGEAEMCGNGIRCFAEYVFKKGLTKKTKMQIETLAGIIEPELIIENNKILSTKVKMGKPIIDNKIVDYPIEINGATYNITSVLLSVPHAVIFVDHLDEKEVVKIGPLIEKHELFPQKTNVNFVKIINPQKIEIKTWERGVGLSKSCGTGACASVVAANINNRTERKVTVRFPTGDLLIEWRDDDTIYMAGDATEEICERP